MREGETFEQMLKRHRIIFEEEHSIRCPFCGHERYPGGDCEGLEDVITYHGEDGAVKLYCWACDEPFWVIESVDRTWKQFKTEEEANE